MADNIVDLLEKLRTEVDDIITLLRSKHEGGYFSYPGGRNIPNLVLSKTDVESIYKKLHAQGSVIQTILGKVRKKYGDEIADQSQQLVDHHARALRIVGALKLEQIHINEAGSILEPISNLKNSVSNTINGVLLLASYDPTGKGIKKSSKIQSGGSFSLSRKSKKILIAIILGILGIGGVTYEIHVNNIQIIGSNGINFGNQQTTIVNNTTINNNSLPPPRQITDQVIVSLHNHLPQNKTHTIHVNYIVNDQEAYNFAKQIVIFLNNNGWTTTFNSAMYPDPFSGIRFTSEPDGTEEIAVGPNQ